MNLLSVDTSGLTGSLALNSRQVAWTKKAMHSEIATVELQKLLDLADIDLRDLTHLAVNIGPGSFTGLRVGISMVKALAYSLNLGVQSLNSLEILAFRHGLDHERIFLAVKSVQNFFFVAGFLKAEGLVRTELIPQVAEEHALGELAKGYTKVLIEGQTAGFTASSEAKDLITLVTTPSFKPEFRDWKSVIPLYLRASEAEEKLKKGLLKPL